MLFCFICSLFLFLTIFHSFSSSLACNLSMLFYSTVIEFEYSLPLFRKGQGNCLKRILFQNQTDSAVCFFTHFSMFDVRSLFVGSLISSCRGTDEVRKGLFLECLRVRSNYKNRKYYQKKVPRRKKNGGYIL